MHEISKIRTHFGFNRITNNGALALFLLNQYDSLLPAVEAYLKDFFLNSRIETIKPSMEIIISCIDNNVPFILSYDNIQYLCLGYLKKQNDFYLVVVISKNVIPYKDSVVMERLEQMKDEKFDQKAIKALEEKIKVKGANYSYLDYVFALKTAGDKSYIQTIAWQPSSEQTMTVIYPPRCNKQALQEYLE